MDQPEVNLEADLSDGELGEADLETIEDMDIAPLFHDINNQPK